MPTHAISVFDVGGSGGSGEIWWNYFLVLNMPPAGGGAALSIMELMPDTLEFNLRVLFV